MVVSNLFLWYDEGQDLFSDVSKKEEKTETKMEEET